MCTNFAPLKVTSMQLFSKPRYQCCEPHKKNTLPGYGILFNKINWWRKIDLQFSWHLRTSTDSLIKCKRGSKSANSVKNPLRRKLRLVTWLCGNAVATALAPSGPTPGAGVRWFTEHAAHGRLAWGRPGKQQFAPDFLKNPLMLFAATSQETVVVQI